jgi:spore germination cell wall hydrolase CwlJ-like protein
MNTLHFFCRLFCGILLFIFFIFIFIFLFLLNLPDKEKIILEDIPIKTKTIKYGLYRNISDKELNCLADNIFFEAGNQSDLGKKAVAYVTLNRMYSTQFPENICSIVYQKKYNVCQFSWVCKNKNVNNKKKKEYEIWQRSLSIANHVIFSYNLGDDPTYGALHFHADYVNPYWSKIYYITTKIDNHIFYRPNNGT